ncbi:structural maintence of chromosome protein 3 [Daphnia sinensis]|uniref:Structural maintence of chromosome protein 3 n=1 Tax=Daphnia sinensis TaxID=1820382 RepID=A0AAD5KXY8_9CRUS|nr:structural maintence of chromosome protein 3 [Daphnia sinensis]
MHIKKNKTVLCLEQGLNVIIGRSGAGKTNLMCGKYPPKVIPVVFLAAIQFVLLSNEFQHLSKRDREHLLLCSSGFRSTSAYAEIIFNNEDRRLPEDKNEVRIRREITSSKDVYLLNGGKVLKHHVEHVLQCASWMFFFSLWISNLAMLSNEKRLELLVEITGANLWNKIRSKDEPLLKGKTEDNLTRFEKDKVQYQKWLEVVTKKKALEATVPNKDRGQLNERIKTAMRLLNDAKAENQSVSAEMAQRNNEVAEAERRFKLYQSEVRSAQGRPKYLAEIAQDLALEHSKLEFELADKRERSVNNNMRLVVCNDYDSTVREEFEINARLMLDEQRRQQLFAKLGREALFSSIEERNDWIHEEQRKLNRLILQEEKEMQNINEEKKADKLKMKNLETVIAGIEVEKLDALNSFKLLKQRKEKMLLEQRRLQMSQSELWRKECDVRAQWKMSYDKVAAFESKLRGAMHWQTQIFEGIEMVLDIMKKKGHGTLAFEMASQYRGLLIDQFTCADEVCCAIDAVAGNRLFYSIVDTDEAASEILKWINREPYNGGFGLPGVFNFYARNRLHRTPSIGPITDKDAVMPLMTQVNCISEMTAVVEQIFGRVLLCRNFADALEAAKTYDIDCVTLEGDTVRRNGVLKGGYCNIAKSGSKIYFEFKKAKQVEQTELAYLKEVESQIRVADHKCNENASELQKIETKLSQTKIGLLEEDLKKHGGELSISRQALERKLAITRKLMMSLEANRANLQMLEDEFQKDFETELGSEERVEVDQLNERIQSAKIKLTNVNATRLKLEGLKNALESRLNDHLLRTKRVLDEKVQEEGDYDLYGAVVDQKAIGYLEEHLQNLECNIKANSAEMLVIEEKVADLSKNVDKSKNEVDSAKSRRLEQQVEVDKRRDAKNKILQSIERKEAALRDISAKLIKLGSFTKEDEKQMIDLYAEWNMKELERELTLVEGQLKSFKGVDRSAELNCADAAKKLTEMKKEMLRFKNDHSRCEELIRNVEFAKNKAIECALELVSKRFREMFQTLVPFPGIGYIKWTYDGEENESDSENEGEPQAS